LVVAEVVCNGKNDLWQNGYALLTNTVFFFKTYRLERYNLTENKSI
jgi:hypothetical protein